eukprot:3717167-Amphidinium_carterae.1
MGKSEQRERRTSSKSGARMRDKSGRSVLVVEDEASSGDSTADKGSSRAKKRAEKKARRKLAKNRNPDAVLDELLACSTLAAAAPTVEGALQDHYQESHAPTSVVSDCEPPGLGEAARSLPRPSSSPRPLGATHAASASSGPPVQVDSGNITRQDLLAFQETLMLSLSAQFGQNIQALNTRLDVIDQDKVALEGRLDGVQLQLSQVQETLAQLAPREGHTPPPVQPLGQPTIARSASPFDRVHAREAHVPHFGETGSIFAAQRGRSLAREGAATPNLPPRDVDGPRPRGDDHSASSQNIVRIASVPPYLRHYEGAEDGSLLRRLVNVGPFAQSLPLEEMRVHLLQHSLVPLDAELHTRAKYSRHVIVVCQNEEDAKLVREQFRLTKPKSSLKHKQSEDGNYVKLAADCYLVFRHYNSGKSNCATRLGWCTSIAKWLAISVVMLCTLALHSPTLLSEQTLKLGSAHTVGNPPPPLPAWRGSWLQLEHADQGDPCLANSAVENVLLTLKQWPLDSVAAWNARALFHHDVDWATRKHKVLLRLLRSSDIVFAFETHHPSLHHLDAYLDCGLAIHLHVSVGPTKAAGGVLCAYVAKPGIEYRCFELIPGRAVVLQLQWRAHTRYYIGCHLHDDRSWEDLVRRVNAFCGCHSESLQIIIGDLNFISEAADMMDRASGKAIGRVGARHYAWQRNFHSWSEVVMGFTHVHSNGKHMSAIDRCFLNVPCPMVSILQPRPKVVGLTSKAPGGSDHYPIMIQFDGQVTSDSQLPKWVAHHGSWKEVVCRWCNQLLDTLAPWQEQLRQVQDAIDSAVSEILRSTCHFNLDDAFVNHCALLLIVRACLRSDRVSLEGLQRRCPAFTWLSPTRFATTGNDAIQRLNGAWTRMLEAELVSYQQPEDTCTASRAQWVSLCLARWRKAQFLSEPSIERCTTSEMEVSALQHYWQEVFNRSTPIDEGMAEMLLPHTPSIPWHSLDLTRLEFAAFIKQAPKTAAGPDGVTYDMIRPLAEPLGVIYEHMMVGMAGGECLPIHFSDSITIFAPKKLDPMLQPRDFRPLSLNSVWSKVPAAVLARQLSRSSATWVHPQQHGFTQGRDTIDALLSLETCVFSMCRLYPYSSAVFADLAQAFASLSRPWVLRCAEASGCPGPLLWYLSQHLQAGYSWIRWRRMTHAGFPLTSGVRQGDPLSGVLFLLAVDGWLRFTVIRWGRDIHLIMFADDLTMVVRSLAFLSACATAVALLEAVAGLSLNFDKTKVLPVGFASMGEFVAVFNDSLTPEWKQVSVVDSLRFLGYLIGRGEVEMDFYAVRKIQARANAIPTLQLGSAANAYLGNVVAFSCAWHVLQVSFPSDNMRKQWHGAVNKLIPGGTTWLGQVLFRVRELLGWPAQVQHLDISSAVAKLRVFLKKVPRVLQGRDIVAMAGGRATHASQVASWQRQGCLSSLSAVSVFAMELGLIRVRESELDAQLVCAWPAVRATLGRVFLPSKESAVRHMRTRLLPLLEAERLAYRFATFKFVDQAIGVSKRIAKFGPAAAVALARLLLNGVPLHAHCVRYGCCWCGSFHTGHHLIAGLARGCYRSHLRGIRAFAFIEHADPNFWFQLIVYAATHNDTLALRRLAKLSSVLVEAHWISMHGKLTGVNTIIEQAWQSLRARRAAQT